MFSEHFNIGNLIVRWIYFGIATSINVVDRLSFGASLVVDFDVLELKFLSWQCGLFPEKHDRIVLQNQSDPINIKLFIFGFQTV